MCTLALTNADMDRHVFVIIEDLCIGTNFLSFEILKFEEKFSF
jgi:hypothetical protein